MFFSSLSFITTICLINGSNFLGVKLAGNGNYKEKVEGEGEIKEA